MNELKNYGDESRRGGLRNAVELADWLRTLATSRFAASRRAKRISISKPCSLRGAPSNPPTHSASRITGTLSLLMRRSY